MIKLPPGILKIIAPDTAAVRENAQRRRAGGRKFNPTWIVYQLDKSNMTVQRFPVFGFSVHKDLVPSDCGSTPPPSWWSTEMREKVTHWFETQSSITVYTTEEESHGA